MDLNALRDHRRTLKTVGAAQGLHRVRFAPLRKALAPEVSFQGTSWE